MNYNPLQWVADALNSLKANVWAMGLIAAGVFLTLKGQPSLGSMLTSAGLAVFNGSTKQESMPSVIPKEDQNAKPPVVKY